MGFHAKPKLQPCHGKSVSVALSLFPLIDPLLSFCWLILHSSSFRIEPQTTCYRSATQLCAKPPQIPAKRCAKPFVYAVIAIIPNCCTKQDYGKCKTLKNCTAQRCNYLLSAM